MKRATVYGLICPIKNKVVYVGSTFRTLRQRLNEHKATFSNSKLGKWIFWLRDLGRLNELRIVTIKSNIEPRMVDYWEYKYILYFSQSRDLKNTIMENEDTIEQYRTNIPPRCRNLKQ